MSALLGFFSRKISERIAGKLYHECLRGGAFCPYPVSVIKKKLERTCCNDRISYPYGMKLDFEIRCDVLCFKSCNRSRVYVQKRVVAVIKALLFRPGDCLGYLFLGEIALLFRNPPYRETELSYGMYEFMTRRS